MTKAELKFGKAKLNIDTSTYTKIHAVKFGLAVGIVTAICAALTVLFSLVGIFQEYTSLAVPWLEATYGSFGYTTSWTGLVLGAIYAGIDAFIFTFIAVWIYNKLL